MSDSAEEKLINKVRLLKDRLAIRDCVARNARGHDRHDRELIASSLWQDAIIEHGDTIKSSSEYLDWAITELSKDATAHTHSLTSHSCETDGDVAHSESYVILALMDRGGTSSRFFSARFIDRMERRGGEWRIAARRYAVDVPITGDASMLTTPDFKELGYSMGARDRSDISYARPLELESPTVKW